MGTLLMRFDKDGQRLSSFRTYYAPRGAHGSSQILVEQDRLVIAADPQGNLRISKTGKNRHNKDYESVIFEIPMLVHWLLMGEDWPRAWSVPASKEIHRREPAFSSNRLALW